MCCRPDRILTASIDAMYCARMALTSRAKRDSTLADASSSAAATSGPSLYERSSESAGIAGDDIVVLLHERQHTVYRSCPGWRAAPSCARDEVTPCELAVGRLGTVGQQVVSPHGRRQTEVARLVAEDTDVSRLGELAALVLEVLGGVDVVEQRVGVLAADEARGEDDGVEAHVVLAHELVELDVVRVLPPLLPLVGVVCGDARVADGRVEPHVQHLVLHALDGDGHTPLEVRASS
ncbi:hypothetical protein L1887_58385 [Cichorium endivia]|nr:hypothetical protein L1887_58385 [Cichorium endivia]